MRGEDFIAVGILAYIATAFVAFGFFVNSMPAVGPASILLGLIVSAIWPASALVWFGAWLA